MSGSRLSRRAFVGVAALATGLALSTIAWQCASADEPEGGKSRTARGAQWNDHVFFRQAQPSAPPMRAGTNTAFLVGKTASAGRVVTYPAPTGHGAIAPSEDFVVRADGQPVAVYSVRVLKPHTWGGDNGPQQFELASMAYFDFEGRVEIEVVSRCEIERVDVRPLRLGIVPAIEGRTLRFVLEQPAKLSIEINGDITRSLQLFAGEIPQPPGRDQKTVRYFGPGVHWPSDEGVPGLIRPQSGQTIYIAGGAVVRGWIATAPEANISDFRVIGRGILLGEDDVRQKAGLVKVGYGCRNVELSGIHLIDSYGWTVDVRGSSEIRICDLRLLGYRGNSDGIDIGSCRNVTVEDCFIRTADDPLVAITIGPGGYVWHEPDWQKRAKPDEALDLENVTFRKCTLWLDRDDPDAIHVGWAMFGRRMSGIRFLHIDILHTRGGQTRQLSVDSSWWGLPNSVIEDVLFEDIRIEDARGSEIFYLRQVNSPCVLRDICFRDIRVLGGGFSKSSIVVHHPQDTQIDGVFFEDIELLGRKIASAEDARLQIAPHSVRNVVFRACAEEECP